jgi:hypothetical protein
MDVLAAFRERIYSITVASEVRLEIDNFHVFKNLQKEPKKTVAAPAATEYQI